MVNINELQQKHRWRPTILDRATIWCGPEPKPSFMTHKTVKWKWSLTCLLLGCRGIRSSLSAVWCRKCGSRTLILLTSPSQIWGGGFQKPFLTWSVHIMTENDKAKGCCDYLKEQKDRKRVRLLFLVGTLTVHLHKQRCNWTHCMTPSCLEATKSMCKLARNDPATISSRRPEVPGATEWRMSAMETTFNSEGRWHHWGRTF